MLYRTLNQDGDMRPITEKKNMLSGSKAVAAAVNSRLLFYYGEWWEDDTLGFALLDAITQERITEAMLEPVSHMITSYILQTQNVADVLDVDIAYNPYHKQMTYKCAVITQRGEQIPLEVNPYAILPPISG